VVVAVDDALVVAGEAGANDIDATICCTIPAIVYYSLLQELSFLL
jgi:hypothetical protein